MRGLPLSILLHAGLAAAVLFAWGSAMRPPAYVPAVPVEIISEAELGEILSVPEEIKVEDAPAEEEPAAPEQIEEVPPAVEDTPPPAPVEDETPPAPVVEETPDAVAADTPPPPEVEQPDPPVQTAVVEEEVEDEFDLDSFGPINVNPEEQSRRPRVTADNPAAGDRNQERIGEGQTLTITEEVQFQSWMEQCWRPISGAPDATSLVVELRIEFDLTGAVQDIAVLNDGEINRSGNSFWSVARREAVAAVNACSPARFLDPGRYEDWQVVQFNFKPPY